MTLALAVGGTAIIGTAVKRFVGLRPDPDGEEDGLDLFDHGEAGYHLDEEGGLAEAHQPPATVATLSAMAGAESTRES